MIIRKCNSCKKVLDKEPYYSIGEIQYTIPGSSYSRFITSKGEHSKSKEIRKESWVDYKDLDFCEECWEKSEFKKWVRK